MPGFTFELTLLSDTVLTRVNATTDSVTLPYLPGAALLGAAARAHYPSDETEAWVLYHSGRVRFGCAFPVTAGGMMVPMPRSVAALKGVPNAATLYNLTRARPDGQLAPLDRAFLSAEGLPYDQPVRSSLRTAIDVETGAAAESKLFALQALPAGTRFVGRVSADDPAVLAGVRQRLDGQTLWIGRSRTAEMGQARLRVLGDAWLEAGEPANDRVVLLCLSDVVLRTPAGAPTLIPAPDHVGLPAGWQYDADSSTIRTRFWSPWNAYRARPDVERQAIESGSVMVFKRVGAAALDLPALCALLDRGVGEHRQDGLGQVWLEPAPLAGPTVTQWTSVGARAPSVADAASLPEPRGPLVAWLTRQAREAQTADARFAAAGVEAENPVYRRIRPAQWGELRALAQTHRDADTLRLRVGEALRTDDLADAARRAALKSGKEAPRVSGRSRRQAWYGLPYESLQAYLQRAESDASLALEMLATLAPRARSQNASEDDR